MVVVGPYWVWYRESAFWNDRTDPEVWTSMKQGMPSKTTTELLEYAEDTKQDVYALSKLERLN